MMKLFSFLPTQDKTLEEFAIEAAQECNKAGFRGWIAYKRNNSHTKPFDMVYYTYMPPSGKYAWRWTVNELIVKGLRDD